MSLCIAIAAVSTASIFIRFAQREAPSLTIAAMRLAIAAVVLAPFVAARHGDDLRRMPPAQLGLAALSGLFLALHFATWISSLEYTSVASSVVLVSTGPLWVAMLSPVFLHERLSRTASLGLFMALVGGVLIGLSGACTLEGGLRCTGLEDVLHDRALWGNLLALVGAWAVTGYLIIGRLLRPALQLVPYIFVTYGMAAIALLLVMLIRGDPILGFDRTTYVWMALLALVPQLIGHSTYNWALRFLPAAVVAVTTLGEPIGSSVLAYFILRETPSVIVVLGGICILAGIYIVARSSHANPGSLPEAAPD